MLKFLCIFIFISVLILPLSASENKLKFADVLTDNMVLQRGKPVVCWGWSKPNSEVEVLLSQSQKEVVAFTSEKVLFREVEDKKVVTVNPIIPKVRISYNEENPSFFEAIRKKTIADENGKWIVELGVHKASYTPTFIAVKSNNESVAIKNLLIGEVWVASGQSNMEWAWTRDKMWENKGLIFNGVRFAKVRGDSYVERESFVDSATVKRGKAFEPWLVCEDGKVDSVSSVAYLFAQYLHRRLKVPVGIINIAQGGSFSREWCSEDVLRKLQSPTVDAGINKLKENIAKDEKAKFSRGPSTLFNARLYPIRHMTVAGVIYLQGENEALAGSLPQYVKTFPGVIESYRTAFNNLDLPFGIITLQGIGLKKTMIGRSSYAVARAIHLATHKKIKNTGYIVAHDVGGGIHPNWKRPIAERSVYWALRDVYKVLTKVGKTQIKEVSFSDRKAVVLFESLLLNKGKWSNPKDVDPRTNDQQPITGFSIAGADRIFYPGKIIKCNDKNGLEISHPFVHKAVALRYAWGNYSPGNIGTWEDPLAPYRTDDWPLVIKDEVFNESSKKLSSAQVNYLKSHQIKNLNLTYDLKLVIAESYEKALKRYAHPKGVYVETVNAMIDLLANIESKHDKGLTAELQKKALHNIPVRYWVKEKYTPARKSKWSWLIERIIRLQTFQEKVEKNNNQPEFKEKLTQLKIALNEFKLEIQNIPDPKGMDIEEMLDLILPIMDLEKEKLTKEGLDMKKYKGTLSKNPF